VLSAAETVAAVLRHPLLEAARSAERQGRCLREAPLTIVYDDVLVEGVVDLAFETDAGMTVIDFKTDRPAGELLETYRRQVAIYAAAIGKATGRPATGLLIQV
jgi:ATP-dependent exoDNAse (exonuclease V) beta subunit